MKTIAKLTIKLQRYWKKITSLTVVGSLLFGVVVPQISFASSFSLKKDHLKKSITFQLENRKSNIYRMAENHRLRRDSGFREDGRLASESRVLAMAANYVPTDHIADVSKEFAKRIEQQRIKDLILKDKSSRKRELISKVSGRTVKVVGNWKRFTVRLGAEAIPFWAALHKGKLLELFKMVWEKREELAELGISVEEVFWKALAWKNGSEYVSEVKENWGDRVQKFIENYVSGRTGDDRYDNQYRLAFFLKFFPIYFEKTEVKVLNIDQQGVIDDINALFEKNLDENKGTYGKLRGALNKVEARVYRGNHLIKDMNTYFIAPMRMWYHQKATRYGPIYVNIVHGNLWLNEEFIDGLVELKEITSGEGIYREMIRAIVERELMIEALDNLKGKATGVKTNFESRHNIVDNAHTPESQNAMIKAVIKVLHYSSDWALSYVKRFPDQRKLFEFIETLPSIARFKEPPKGDNPSSGLWGTLGGGLAGLALFLNTSFNTNVSPADAFNGAASGNEFSIIPWIVTVTIGFVWYYLSHRNQLSENLQLETASQGIAPLRAEALLVSNPLNETGLVNRLFSFYHTVMDSIIEEPGIRFISNIKDLTENPAKLANLQSFEEDAKKEGDQSLAYEIVVITDKNNVMSIEDTQDFLRAHGMQLSHVRILHHPELKKSILVIDGFTGRIEFDLKGKKSVDQAA
ncbi:MAG: hypothetical protein HYT97_07600 [Elusimicrobia bacterium]|nr:hypothetical protein [Elusimicrobiota bacterium]